MQSSELVERHIAGIKPSEGVSPLHVSVAGAGRGVIVVLIGILGLAAGCSRVGGAPSAPPPEATETVESPESTSDEDWPIVPVSSEETVPPEAHGRPEETNESSPGSAEARGRELFENNCAGCHGAEARGTAAAPSLRLIAGQLAEGDRETTVRRQISRGSKRMPSFSQLEHREVDALVTYLTELGSRKGDSTIAHGSASSGEDSSSFEAGPWRKKHRKRGCRWRGKKKKRR